MSDLAGAQPPQPLHQSTFSAGRFGPIRDVQSPLGFYVFFTIVVDGFVALVAIFAPLPEWARILFIALAFLLAVAIAGGVFWLVVKHPSNLVFGERAHLRIEEMRFGSGAHTMPVEVVDSLPSVEPPTPPLGQLPSPTEGS